jgi:DNA-binding response OmpR family regulator
MPPFVLIVEPDAAHAQALADTLRFAGFHTRTVARPSALPSGCPEAHPAVVLVEVGLAGEDPEGAVQQWITDLASRRIPIIAMAAEPLAGERARLISRTCAGFYPLTASARQLLMLVRAVLPHPSGGADAAA